MVIPIFNFAQKTSESTKKSTLYYLNVNPFTKNTIKFF